MAKQNQLKKATSLKDAIKDPRIESLNVEYIDGIKSYWIILQDNYINTATGTASIHAKTVKDMLYELNNFIEEV